MSQQQLSLFLILSFPTDLTGGADGSIKMFEFGTPKPVSVLRAAGAGPGITQIRFTRQGNKVKLTLCDNNVHALYLPSLSLPLSPSLPLSLPLPPSPSPSMVLLILVVSCHYGKAFKGITKSPTRSVHVQSNFLIF